MNKVEVYYLKKEFKNQMVPYAAVAIEMNEDKTVNRGISVCSKKDAFVKQKGRNLALARLKYVNEIKSNKFPVKEYNGKKEKKNCEDIPFKFYGYYKDIPTEAEKKMFK